MPRLGILSICLLMLCHLQLRAGDELVQLTGYIQETEFGAPLPYAHVLNPGKNIGKISNIDGYFSIVGHVGDTIVISSVVSPAFSRATSLARLMAFTACLKTSRPCMARVARR